MAKFFMYFFCFMFLFQIFRIFALYFVMLDWKKYILNNGLTVLTHEAWDTPLATVNVLYNVGARDEAPGRTGFAHLFEHLMFGGTERVPDYDAVVSSLGGDNNAFTNNDITNYYVTLPAGGLQTALDLEADRMEGLNLTQKALEVQQRVVKEEYNQRYMNQSYGDMWLLLRSLCYKVSPYRWATIGADIRHVAEATLEDVQQFHERFYRPDNAILAVAAPLTHEEMVGMAERAFGTLLLPRKRLAEDRCFARERTYPLEPLQTASRRLEAKREVPTDAVYMAWPMCERYDADFQACDLISDILGTGNSSRLYRGMVCDGRLVSESDACITGDAGQGLLMVSAKVREGADPEEVVDTIRREVRSLVESPVDPYELEKVTNKYESTFVFSQYKASDRAMGLCYYTWLGDTSLVNREPELYRRVTPDGLQQAAQRLFREENENLLIIRRKER